MRLHLCYTSWLQSHHFSILLGKPQEDQQHKAATSTPFTSEGCNKFTRMSAPHPSPQHHVLLSPPPTSQLSHLAWKSWGKHKLLPSLGNVPGEQGAHAVTFTLLQLEGTVVVRDGAVGGSPGDVVTSGGVAEAPVDAAVGA